MIKVSVMYPNSPGVRFDHSYGRGLASGGSKA